MFIPSSPSCEAIKHLRGPHLIRIIFLLMVCLRVLQQCQQRQQTITRSSQSAVTVAPPGTATRSYLTLCRKGPGAAGASLQRRALLTLCKDKSKKGRKPESEEEVFYFQVSLRCFSATSIVVHLNQRLLHKLLHLCVSL